MPNSQLDLLTCIETLEKSLSGALELPHSFSEEQFQLACDYLKLLFCAEEWSSVLDFSSKVIAEEKVRGLKLSTFYRYWLEALQALEDPEALQSLAGHLLSLSSSKKPSQERLSLALFALIGSNQKISSGVLLRRLFESFPKKKHVEERVVYHYHFGQIQPVTKTEVLQFCQGANFLSLVNLFQFTRYTEICEILLDQHPYCVIPYLHYTKEHLERQEYSEALRWIELVREWYPQNLEALIGQAYCLKQMGDPFFAHKILETHAGLFDAEDWDYLRLKGEIASQLYQRYAQEKFRVEAIRTLERSLDVSRRLQLDTFGIESQLQELQKNAPEKGLERRKPLQHAGQRYWLVQLEEKRFRSFLEKIHSSRLLCPRELKKDDRVILGIRQPEQYSAYVVMRVEQMPLEKNKSGKYYARLSTFESLKPTFFEKGTLQQKGGLLDEEQKLSGKVSFFQISKKAWKWILKSSLYDDKSIKDNSRERFYAS